MSIDKFMTEYEPRLRAAHAERPLEYAWPLSELPAVLVRMRSALERGSMSIDSPAIRATCKALGIRHTRKAIRAFLNGETP